MKTDSLFYRLFKTLPSLLFDLLDEPCPEAARYGFRSVEIKQTGFRIDGVFAPPEANEQLPLFFIEVQFQPDKTFYGRFFAEIFLYLYQYPPRNPWQAVVIYPSRSEELDHARHYRVLLDSPQVQRIYLDDLARKQDRDTPALGLVRLIVADESEAIPQAQRLMEKVQQEALDKALADSLTNLIETILVYKLPRLSREEIQDMLGLKDVEFKQTRFYQDVFAEGRQEGRQQEGSALVLRLLTRRLGKLDAQHIGRIQALGIPLLEDLAEALLEFEVLSDLDAWLKAH
ncbi:MAG: Rpn family recombination-promoting nuclease/putative transposase [Methylococcaceae bacterium]|nr:Rpn family recombination-promoting nuclease/putative transposase [Methylococcaceae bacterium]